MKSPGRRATIVTSRSQPPTRGRKIDKNNACKISLHYRRNEVNTMLRSKLSFNMKQEIHQHHRLRTIDSINHRHIITTGSDVFLNTKTHTIKCSARFMASTKLISSHLSPLTSKVVGAPRMTLQQYISTPPCRPLPSGNLQTPFPSIPWCYLPISFSVFLSFLVLSLTPAELSSQCQRVEMGPYHLSFFTMVRRSR